MPRPKGLQMAHFGHCHGPGRGGRSVSAEKRTTRKQPDPAVGFELAGECSIAGRALLLPLPTVECFVRAPRGRLRGGFGHLVSSETLSPKLERRPVAAVWCVGGILG